MCQARKKDGNFKQNAIASADSPTASWNAATGFLPSALPLCCLELLFQGLDTVLQQRLLCIPRWTEESEQRGREGDSCGYLLPSNPR
jgi:hypothetical protein